MLRIGIRQGTVERVQRGGKRMLMRGRSEDASAKPSIKFWRNFKLR